MTDVPTIIALAIIASAVAFVAWKANAVAKVVVSHLAEIRAASIEAKKPKEKPKPNLIEMAARARAELGDLSFACNDLKGVKNSLGDSREVANHVLAITREIFQSAAFDLRIAASNVSLAIDERRMVQHLNEVFGRAAPLFAEIQKAQPYGYDEARYAALNLMEELGPWSREHKAMINNARLLFDNEMPDAKNPGGPKMPSLVHEQIALFHAGVRFLDVLIGGEKIRAAYDA